jgi:hypothetical protein
MDIHEFLRDKLEIFKNLYDIIIIIDPAKKKTISIDNNFKGNINKNYDWIIKREEFYDKSISQNAYLSNNYFVKIECIEGKMFLINATPINYGDKIYILETIKDISANSEATEKVLLL